MTTPAAVDLPDVGTIRRRVGEVWDRVEAAGGDRHRIGLVAVTKAFPVDLVERALAAGLVDLGENYAQELVAKAESIEASVGGAESIEASVGGAERIEASVGGAESIEASVGGVESIEASVGGAESIEGREPRWHFIGGLQRNKVKLVAEHVALWHSIDRASLVTELAKRSPGARLLVQVNTTGEAQKSGCEPSEVSALVERAVDAGLDVVGLMTVGPTERDADSRPCFERLRHLAEAHGLDELSMGMSADFEAAVAEGATLIRLGSSLFGPRPGRVR